MLAKIQESFHEVFGVPLEKITIDTTMENLPEWDSMKHMELIISLETKFHIAFEVNEIIELITVRNILETISSKLT